MRRIGRWFVALFLAIFRREAKPEPPPDPLAETEAPSERSRIVEAGPPSPRAELAVIALLLCTAAAAIAFSVLYSLEHLAHRTQYLGLALGVSLASLSAALIVIGKTLIVEEEIEEDYPDEEHEDEQAKIEQIVEESGSRITRKKLLGTAGAAAGGALGFAALTPALSFGPLLQTSSLHQTPWHRGRRLVDENGKPWLATDIEQGNFYTAYPDGADKDEIGAPVVVVRIDPSQVKMPPERRSWTPEGIIAYSKICTHAGCALNLYRAPLFQPVEARPALVCPCHYSTFNVATGGTVLAGPAGRALPQLPLEIDSKLQLRAGGNFSGAIGPSWSHVREGGAT